MNYDEKKFAASANKKTMGMWLAMLVELSGVIMRCTDNKGTCIVGGRFLEDDADIMNYVNTYIRE